MPHPFHPFSAGHFITVAVGAVVTACLLLAGKRGGRSRRVASAILVFACLSAYPLGQAAWLTMEAGKSWDNILPFHLCDIAAVTGAFALITRRPLLAALTYFWGLAATLQALLTPAITIGFPHPPFLMFFVHHFAIVATALYLPIVEGWRPKSPFWKTPLEVLAWSIAYLAFSMTLNTLLGTNFGFSSHPPPNPSLIDYLGPWPWYLVSMTAIAALFFLLLALPFARRPPPGK